MKIPFRMILALLLVSMVSSGCLSFGDDDDDDGEDKVVVAR
jgi:hypothetical protein